MKTNGVISIEKAQFVHVWILQMSILPQNTYGAKISVTKLKYNFLEAPRKLIIARLSIRMLESSSMKTRAYGSKALRQEIYEVFPTYVTKLLNEWNLIDLSTDKLAIYVSRV